MYKYISALKKMTIKGFRDFIYENYYRQIGFPKKTFNETSA